LLKIHPLTFFVGKKREPTTVSDELPAIVGRCLTGHQASIRQLIDRFQGRVFGLCYRMLGHRQDAEDATQETFVRVVKNLHRWDSKRAFEPWLLTIAGNRCRTQLAKRGKHPLAHSLDFPLEDPRSAGSDITPMSNSQLLREEVDLALGQLRDEYRIAFEMFHDQGLSYQEIAQSFQVPLGTVKTWVHRARRDLIHRLRQRGILNES
jgi:RNA polymerase sigma-70 factor (ECF subfamily)